MLHKIKHFLSGSVFTLAVAIPMIALATDLWIDTEGTPTIIADNGYSLTIGTSDESTPGDIIFKLDDAEAARLVASTGNLDLASASDLSLTAGDLIIETTDRGVGADANDQTVNVCGGTAGAACNAEAVGAFCTFEGIALGGATAGGAIACESGAGTDGTADISFQVNHDDSDFIVSGGTTPATLLTIEGDNGNITSAKGHLIFGTSGDTIQLQEATAGAKCMGTVTANGTTAVPVATTCAATGARIFLTRSSAPSGTAQCWQTNIQNGVSFDLDCDGAETGTFDWVIIQEAAG